MRPDISRHRLVWLHISYWCVYVSFFIYQIYSRSHGDITWERLTSIVTINLIFTGSIAYLNYFFFLPRFLKIKRFWQYFLEFSIAFTLIIMMRLYMERYFLDGFTGKEEYLYRTRFVVQVSAITLFNVIFVGMLRFAADWFELEARKKTIENEKLTAELNFLKAQINPHFLFNTLNNLYYLAFTQSPNTTEVIDKLSQMMRYMIYDSNHPQVLLSKEIEYMRNYISLEKLRLNNQIPIKFEVNGNTEGVFISPLIFITFLENAFKHGISNTDSKAWVNISLEISWNQCIYTVENSIVKQKSLISGEKSGIGLQNVKRRLELSYPGKYELNTKEKPESYYVELKLDLN